MTLGESFATKPTATVNRVASLLTAAARRKLVCIRYKVGTSIAADIAQLAELFASQKVWHFNLLRDVLPVIEKDHVLQELSTLPHQTSRLLAQITGDHLKQNLQRQDLLIVSGLELLIKYPFPLPMLLHSYREERHRIVVFVPHDEGLAIDIPLLWDHFEILEP